MILPALYGEVQPLEGGFALTICDDWLQGRTAYGGFSASLALETARHVAGAGLPPLRSAQVSFVGPLFGAVEVRARVLRRGRNATWVSAEILRDGEVGLTATFVFMGAAESTLHLNDRPAPDPMVPLDQAAGFEMRNSPTFLRENFEVRFALPRVGAKRGQICWWVRSRHWQALAPMTDLLLIADALPPGVMPLLTPKTPVSSMTWQANLLSSAPATRDGWWLLCSTGDYAEHGCSSQQMEVWNADGAPVMAGMQSIALFG